MQTVKSADDVVFYDREYECPNCGVTAIYNEEKNVLSKGRVERKSK